MSTKTRQQAVKCTNCGVTFPEHNIIIKQEHPTGNFIDQVEYCPHCNTSGHLINQ